jgi:hypothetical protein
MVNPIKSNGCNSHCFVVLYSRMCWKHVPLLLHTEVSLLSCGKNSLQSLNFSMKWPILARKGTRFSQKSYKIQFCTLNLVSLSDIFGHPCKVTNSQFLIMPWKQRTFRERYNVFNWMKLNIVISRCWLQEMSYSEEINVLQQDIWAIPCQFVKKVSKIDLKYIVSYNRTYTAAQNKNSKGSMWRKQVITNIILCWIEGTDSNHEQ